MAIEYIATSSGQTPTYSAKLAVCRRSPVDEQATQRVGLSFQWAWDSIEQHQEAIGPNLTEVK
jgi:hypothetical protein